MEANSAYECLNRTPKRHAWMGQMTDVDDEACYSDWDKLPQELAERVLACLPVASVFQCRSVCKKWMSILTSSSFLDLWAKVLLMASSGGLLCFRSRNTEFTTLTVCNPVTKTFRVLPDMLQIRYIDILGMVADRNSNSYKILVTGTTESSVGYSITELYDSSTESWVHHCHSERDCLQFWYEVHAIWCEGFFYCLTMMPISSTQGYRLLAYDMQQKDWFDLSVKIPSNNLRCPSLLACQGRLLLTGKIVVENTIKSVCIWELDRISLKWKEIDSMPAFILNKIHVPHFLVIQCFGNSDLICFSRYRGSQSVMYDLSRKTWHWIPDNNVCKERKAQDTTALDRNNLVGMSFEPSLASKV
eukprot:c29092_g1_i8 orf=2647-3723(+)